MKATGVVRRIDELGRVVIPKELRKTLRIKEGDNLEIFINNDEEIVLKKFSLMNKLVDFAQNFTDAIYSFVHTNIMVMDNDTFLAVSGSLKKDIVNQSISDHLSTSIERREDMLEKHKKKIRLTDRVEIEGTYAISSIIVNGDAIGLVMVVSPDSAIGEMEHKLAQITAKVLSKHLEE